MTYVWGDVGFLLLSPRYPLPGLVGPGPSNYFASVCDLNRLVTLNPPREFTACLLWLPDLSLNGRSLISFTEDLGGGIEVSASRKVLV